MKMQKLWFFLLVMLLVMIKSEAVNIVGSQLKEAYATLLYGDEYLLGARVLGKSIRDTGSTKDMVALASDGVSDYALKLLQADGWIVEKISLLENPNKVHAKKLWGIYTKLRIFNMTNYKKVIYLDADTLVVKNIEALFRCGKFCANLKHTERLNAGVLVVEPSQPVFNDMMSKITVLPSYTAGDQGFLVSYYPDFPNAHLFDPNVPMEVLNSRNPPEMERLPALYNGDVGLYMINNKWMSMKSKLRILHYTLGPFKPWDWYTSWLFFEAVDIWQSVREQLDESLPGTGGGRNPKDELLVKVLCILPFASLFCFYCSSKTMECSSTLWTTLFRKQIKHLCNNPSSSTNNVNHQVYIGLQAKIPGYLGGLSICIFFMVAFLSLGIAISIVPRQVMPWTGLLLTYEWTFTIFFFLFGGFLRMVYLWGKRAAFQHVGPFSTMMDSEKGHQMQGALRDFTTWCYGLVMALLAVSIPFLPCAFSITALFYRVRSMMVGCIFVVSFMTFAAYQLAIRSFSKGLDHGTRQNQDTQLLVTRRK